MREQLLIDARDQLLGIARQEFECNVDVVALFMAGSLAAGSHDAYSDIDLRVVVKPEKQQWFIEHGREEALRVALSLLYENRYFLLWRKRPAALAMAYIANHDPLGPPQRHRKVGACFGAPGIQSNGRGSRFSISKGLAAAHEVFRRARRGELVFAQTLLDELRFHIIQADDWLFDRTPRTQLFSKFDHRGSPDVVQCLRASFVGCDRGGLDAALAALCRLYRRQIEQLALG